MSESDYAAGAGGGDRPLQRRLERPRPRRDHGDARARHGLREPHRPRARRGRGRSASHIGAIFETWPDIRFEGRRTYCRDGLVVQEWTATATHANEMRRGDLVAEPTGKRVTWDGLDVIPFEDGLVKRKDVYSDSVTILRRLGLL